MSLLRAGDPGGVFVSARLQTGGRGRQGRAWQSPPGNLYASLALRDPGPLMLAPQLGFVAGVALVRALQARCVDPAQVTLKWPNDVLFGGAKLAGILLESAQMDGGFGCVIGFGVNCVWAPPDLPYPATSLTAAGDPSPDPTHVLDALATTFAAEFALWRSAGFAAIRQRWLDGAGAIGRPLRVRTSGSDLTGSFDGIDDTGRLRLCTAAGLRVIDAGDIAMPTHDCAHRLSHRGDTAPPERQS